MRFNKQILLLFVLIILFSFLLILFQFEFWPKSGDKCLMCGSKQCKGFASNGLPMIYVITPTYDRYVQKAELTRLSHTLLLVPNIHWILVEDSPFKTAMVTKFITDLQDYGDLLVTHLNIETPKKYKMKSSDPNWLKPRGVLQRNLALKWIRDNVVDHNSIVYFADDDNTYDLKLFNEMRFTKGVSVWSVGLVGGLVAESPVVSDGRVVSWNAIWKRKRKFPIDMSGFAINVNLLLKNPNAMFALNVERGYQETHLLMSLVANISDLEPKASNCTQVLVWHTRTQDPKLTRKNMKNIRIPKKQNEL